MEENRDKSLDFIFWIVAGLVVGWLLFFSDKKEPEYITREFKNGNSLEVEVDDSITSDNWDCTGDCSGHNAGYEWAADKGIDEPGDCGGNSVSFIEGCEAYANEN
jgi:hypothetical protein